MLFPGRIAILFSVFIFTSTTAHAGMPDPVELTSLAQMRLDTLSFFIFVVLATSFIFQKIWNMLQKDFQSLPRFNYKQAVGFILIWGLALNLILAMISGARELMTTGAWEKNGISYKVKENAAGTNAKPNAESGVKN